MIFVLRWRRRFVKFCRHSCLGFIRSRPGCQPAARRAKKEPRKGDQKKSRAKEKTWVKSFGCFLGLFLSGSIFMDGDIDSFGKVKVSKLLWFYRRPLRLASRALIGEFWCPIDAVAANSQVCTAAQAFLTAARKTLQIQRPAAVVAVESGFGRVGEEVHCAYWRIF